MREHSVDQASRLLGVSPQRVRAMLAAGRLRGRKVGRAWIVSDADRSHRGPAGRPLSAANAWALLALLAHDEPGWVDPAVRSRLRRRIREGGALRALEGSAPRAIVHRWRVLPKDVDKLVDEFPLVPSGLSARHSDLDVVAGSQELDAYVHPRHLGRIKRRFRPDLAPERPNVLLRLPSDPWILERSGEVPLPVAAADLLQSDDPRVVRAGRRILGPPHR